MTPGYVTKELRTLLETFDIDLLSRHSLHSQVPEADGLVYNSRFTSDGCIAIFDRAFSALHSQAIQPLTQVQDVHEALRTAGITLVRH